MQTSGLALTEGRNLLRAARTPTAASGTIRAGSAGPLAASWSPQRWDRRQRRSRMWRARSTWR